MLRTFLGAQQLIPANPWVNWDGSKDGAFTTIPNSVDIYDAANFDVDRSLVVYADSNTGLINAIVATTSGTVVTYHTPQAIDPTAQFSTSVCALDTGRCLVAYGNASGGITCVVISIDGSNNITVNLPTVISTTIGFVSGTIRKLVSDQCILIYQDATTVTPTFTATVVTTTGTSVDLPHALLQIDNYYPVYANLGILSPTSVFVAYSADMSGNGVNGIVLTIASNTVSKFSSHNLVSSSVIVTGLLSCQSINSTQAVVVYSDFNAATSLAFVVTITDSSGNMVAGNPATFYNNFQGSNVLNTSNPLCFIDSATLMVLFSSSDASQFLACALSISGNIVTPHNIVTLASQTSYEPFGILLDSNRILAGGLLVATGSNMEVLSIV